MRNKVLVIGAVEAANTAGAIEHLIALAHVGAACIRDEAAASRLKAMPDAIGPSVALTIAAAKARDLVAELRAPFHCPKSG